MSDNVIYGVVFGKVEPLVDGMPHNGYPYVSGDAASALADKIAAQLADTAPSEYTAPDGDCA